MANTNVNVSIEQYARYMEEEEERQELYLKNIWAKKVAEPNPPTVEELNFWRIGGLEFSLFVTSALGAALLSAIRTGGLFWLLEELLFAKFPALSGLSSIFGFLSMASALMAFEGFLLAYGLTKGKESGKMEVSTTGLWISIITVMAAGIFSSFSIVTVSVGWQAFMNIVLALITGGASALVAYFSSENLGFILNHINDVKRKIQEKHKNDWSAWREQGIKSYNSARAGIMKNINSMSSPSEIEKVVNETESSVVDQKKLSKAEKVYSYIQKYYSDHGRLPRTNQDVVDATGISMGTVYVAMSDFKVNNQEELIFKGLVTQDDITAIMNKRGKSVDAKITDFIKENGRFPMSEDQAAMGVSVQQAAKYVKDNQEHIRANNLLSEEIINDAITEASK